MLARDDAAVWRATAFMALVHMLLWLAPRRRPAHLGPAVWASVAVDVAWATAVVAAGGDPLGPLAGLFLITSLWAAVGYAAPVGIIAGLAASTAVLWLVHDAGGDALGPAALGNLAFFWATIGFAVLATAAGDRELRMRATRLEALHIAGERMLRADAPDDMVRIAQEAAARLMPDWTVRLRPGSAPSGVVLRRDGLDGVVVVPVVADGQAFGVIECRRPLAARVVRHSVRVREISALQTLATLLAGGMVRARLVAGIRRQSMTDGLTGLGNRRAFDAELDRRLAEAGRSGQPLSLCLLDIDHFKSFNDSFGHRAGDEALAAVAGVLRRVSRSADIPARYGGEEMALVLPATGTTDALRVAERVRAAIEAHPMAHRRVTVSIGVASCLGDCSPEVLIEAADRALYEAKQDGRNRVRHGSPVHRV